MDPDQFRQFMAEFARLMPATAPSTPAAQNLTFETFDPDTESFTTYKQRLENYFAMKQINNDVEENKLLRKQTLINSLGSKNYNVLCGILTPKLPTDLTYVELMATLEKHFCPPVNELIEQHKFLTRVQAPTESIAQYVTALKQMSASCNFTCPHSACKKSNSEIFLRAQFIRGIRDSSLREKLLQEKKLTFETAENIAVASEVSREGNKIISTSTTSNPSTSSNTVNRISRRDNQQSAQKYTPRSKSRAKSQTGYQRKNKLDYKKLGIDGLCLRCARSNHKTQDCRIKKELLKCKSCDKTGHVDKVCIFTLTQSNKKAPTEPVKSIDNVEGEDEYFIHQIEIPDIFHTSTNENEKKFFLTPKVEHVDITMEVDSGSPVSIVGENELKRLKIKHKIQPTNIRFKTYTGQVFKPLGITTVYVKLNGYSSKLQMYVVQGDANTIMGRGWMRALGLDIVQGIKNISETESTLVMKYKNDVLSTFGETFKKVIGCVPNIKISLKLRENTKPIFIKHRPVPSALLDKVNAELDLLEKQGIITKTEYSEWGSPIVTVVKPDSTRICGDYKCTVNPSLYDVRYPIPSIEDTFGKLGGKNKVYCKLDAYKAYLHFLVDAASAQIQVITTHRGCYLVNRLSNGIKIAPNEFQRVMDLICFDMEGVAAFFDDFIIAGENIQQCYERLCKLLSKLQSMNIHLNPAKCRFFESRIAYLGHVISEKGLHKSEDKVEAILNAPKPTTSEEMESFLGLVMYYAKFIPNVSSITAPLRQLTQKNVKFTWTPECQNSLEQLKKEIASPTVLINFDPSLPLYLATDASPTGIGGVLSHIVNGEERPILFISRALTKAERNYSQLDREALAVYWSVKRLYTHLCGRKFTLVCDNKPLTHIFAHNKKLPVMSASRLIRYASFLSSFDYTVQHRNATQHANVDYLSRSPLPIREEFEKLEDYDTVFYNETIQIIESESLIFNDIVRETQIDPVLKELLNSLKNDRRDPEYNLHKGIILQNNRVYIPATLQAPVLRELHSTHIGMEKMKQLARRHVYWPGIDKDIESVVRSCETCAKLNKNPPKVPTHRWEPATAPWSRIHIDYAGPKDGIYYFVTIDAYSNWTEIFPTRTAPTSQSTIKFLCELFSRYGIPCTLVSDNASIFTSDEFSEFCTRNGINHKFSAPNHPASNGKAERAVGILKKRLNSISSPISNIQAELNKILFKWRVTPLATGKSPDELFLNRKLRTPLDILRPPPVEKSTLGNQPKITKSFNIGDRVLSRNYQGEKWLLGVISKKLGKLHYIVKLDTGREIKRHIDQLRATEVPLSLQTNSSPKSVKINPTPIIHYYNNSNQRNHQREQVQPEQQRIPERINQRQIPVEPVRRSTRTIQKPHWLNQYST